MKKSINRNFDRIVFYTSSIVAQKFATPYWGNSQWEIRRAADGRGFVAFSHGVRKGPFPYIGSLTRSYDFCPWGGGGAFRVADETVAEILKQAQTKKGYWAKNHGAFLKG